MKSVVLLSQKGGSGKTTLTVHLSVIASMSGLSVALIDTDPQGSASAWGAIRGEDIPVIVNTQSMPFDALFRKAHEDHFDLCIVDTPPHSTPEASDVASVADLILIPCRPTAFDLNAIQSSLRIVRASASQTRAAVVLNSCPARAPEIEESIAFLKAQEVDVSPVTITERRAYSRAVASGRAVTEFERKGKAALEILELWGWMTPLLFQTPEHMNS